MMEAVRYRAGQFLRALTARRSISEERVAQAIRILTPEARALFARQAAQDQRHALAVYETLRRSEHTNSHLLVAALLHDVGKAAARLPAWQRAMVVLLARLAPRLLDWMVRRGRDSSAGPVAIYLRHAEIGAEWAEGAGCSPLTVALIRRHEDRRAGDNTEEDRMLAALQAADTVS